MQQEANDQILAGFEKLEIPKQESMCLDVQCCKNQLVAQIFKNNKIVIYNYKTNTSFELESEKLLYSCTFSHHDSFNRNQLYLFGQSIQILDMEKQIISHQINTEFTYCGDSNIWNEVCAANEKTILFWDIRQKLPFNCILAHSMQITQCKYNETGRYVTTTGLDNCARVFDSYGTDSLVTICGSKKTHTTSSQFTKDSRHLIVSTLEQPLGLWDWVECNQLAQYKIQFQNRFFIRPIVVYDDKDIPKVILYPNDNNQIYQFNFLKPDEKPLIQSLDQFGNEIPIRLIKNDEDYFIFGKNEIIRCKYKF
ncbi:unnamed protein product [Paramecium primaurelia]|uniref:Uncharacterized protein n=1 Tax=Paramecium primaurelia TaxID=5886 RepID=A0A8S1QHC0_PARPR|nr:unnamed protein product [Paramecium primaurelia]